MKNFHAKIYMILAFAFLFSQDVQAYKSGKGAYHTEEMKEQCHGLSKEMYEFSTQLADANRKMFCAEFSKEERKKAMQMANQQNVFGVQWTPDQAVEKVANERKGNSENIK